MIDWKYEITEAVIVAITAALLIFFANDTKISAAIFFVATCFCIYGAVSKKSLEPKIQWHWLILATVAGFLTFQMKNAALAFILFYSAARFFLSLIRRSETKEIFSEVQKIQSKCKAEIESLNENFRLKLQDISEDFKMEQLRENILLEAEYKVNLNSLQQKLKTAEQQQIRQINELYNQHQAELENILRENKTALEEMRVEIEREKISAVNAVMAANREEIERLKILLKEQDDYIQKLEDKSSRSKNEIFSNFELHKLLIETMNRVKVELDIMSPWVSRRIVNNDMKRRLKNLLERGVTVKLAYGIENDKYPKADSRNEQVKNFVAGLCRQFRNYPNFHVKKINSHGKIFICDNDYYVLTSLNPLSNDGTLWEEVGEKSYNEKNLTEYRRHYFDFSGISI